MADYYTDSNVPSTGGALSSAVMRAEFDLISAAFVKVAPYTGNGGKAVCINAGGTAQEAVTCTGTGNVVRATSPTLTTPDIGTPSAGVLTNCTGLPVAGGGTGRATSTTAYGLIAAGTTATGAHQTLAAGATTEILVGGGASALPVWTAATGTGAPVRAGSPTFTGTIGANIIAATGAISGTTITGSGIVRGNTASGTGLSSAVVGVASLDGCGVYGQTTTPAGGSVGVFGSGASYDFYAGGAGTNYGPFTGGHDGLFSKSHKIEQGDIVIDVSIIHRANLSNTIAHNECSNVPADKRVVGVFNWRAELVRKSPPAALIVTPQKLEVKGEVVHITPAVLVDDFDMLCKNYDRVSFNAIGEGQINVCKEGGNIVAGDYIQSSSVAGKGMKQLDDVYHSYTVAKVRESAFWDDGDNSIKQVACIYLCG